MKYCKLRINKHNIYFAIYDENKPYLFYNLAPSTLRIGYEKEWVWGSVKTWKDHGSGDEAQIVSKLEVLVACGSVPSDEQYITEHFPTFYERYEY